MPDHRIGTSDRSRFPWTLTLRLRVMIWQAVVVVLTAAVTLVGMQIGVRKALLHEVDSFLLDDIDGIRQSLASEQTRSDQPSAERALWGLRRLGHGRFAVVLDARGGVLWQSQDQPANLSIPLPLGDFGPWSRDGYRIVGRQAIDGSGNAVYVRVGIPLAVLSADVRRVDSLAAMLACVVLVIAPLLSYWMAGRVVAALRDMTRRTARLRPTQLDQRLPTTGSGDELDQLARTINGLLDRIASYVSRRDDVLADAAHELRTPIAAIQSTAELALESERTREEYESFLSDVVEECSALEQLVNQLLMLSASDGDRLRIHGQHVALDAIVRRCVEMFADAAQAVDIALHASLAPVVVEGNPHHLRQVVSNLLDNALKATPSGGRITVELVENAPLNAALLTVADTGCGIAEEELPRIFERFYRCDKSRSHRGAARGAGLGLSICQAIVAAHGGQIRVESRLGEGSRFTVQLPLVRDVPAAGGCDPALPAHRLPARADDRPL